MRIFSFAILFSSLMVTACGQPGPLYLPTDKPPIYVEPDAEAETKDAEKQPVSPPQPENQELKTE
jgi:predicted small lipoprotein YifL